MELRVLHSRKPKGPLCGSLILAGVLLLGANGGSGASPSLQWQKLPPLPDPAGVAGAFAGVSNGALLVAGGANFPGKMPWDGGVKAWHDEIYVLENPSGTWKNSGRLPSSCAYGLSVSVPEGLLCVGGSSSDRHLTDTFVLAWNNENVLRHQLPPLPVPIAYACGAVLDSNVYLAGGSGSPDATNALRCFFRLDLSNPANGWAPLPPWPGVARMLATAATVDGTFFLVGGVELSGDSAGKPVRRYLSDAFAFSPGTGTWRKLADLPNPVAAAPSPAPPLGTGFLLIGGDDGTLANFEPRSRHPGFPGRILRYDVPGDRWEPAGDTPAPRVTQPVVQWQGMSVFVSGEMKPGVRSPDVWAFRVE